MPSYIVNNLNMKNKVIVSIKIEPLNSHEWQRQNLSLQCQYNSKHASNENKGKYLLVDY